MGDSSTPTFAMQCPHCPARLRVKKEDFGTKRSCPRCGHPITVERPPAGDSPGGGSAQAEFGIVCTLCGSRFYARPDQIGQMIDCPDCLTEHQVDAPTPQVAPKKTVSDPDEGDEYQLRPLEEGLPPETAANDEAAIYVSCSVCGTVLSATPDRFGRTVSCHDCGTRTMVPRPSSRPKRPRVVPTDPHIGIDEAADLKENRERAAKLMAEAHEHEEELARQLPEPPTHPFTQDIYNYPWMSRIIPVWATLAPLLLAITTMVTWAASAEGLQMVAGVALTIASVVLSVVFILTFGFYVMQIIQSTAVGYRQPEEWARFEFGEALGGAAYLFGALFLSILPVMLIARMLPPVAVAPALVVCLFVLYPIILMSMLEAGTPAMPFTRHVWRTLTLGSSTWCRFYLAAAILCGLVALLVWVSTSLGSVGSVLDAVLLVIGLTIYFRLLGRLAWALDQLPIKETPPADDD